VVALRGHSISGGGKSRLLRRDPPSGRNPFSGNKKKPVSKGPFLGLGAPFEGGKTRGEGNPRGKIRGIGGGWKGEFRSGGTATARREVGTGDEQTKVKKNKGKGPHRKGGKTRRMTALMGKLNEWGDSLSEEGSSILLHLCTLFEGDASFVKNSWSRSSHRINERGWFLPVRITIYREGTGTNIHLERGGGEGLEFQKP